jgi:CRP/FNR family transcriptional regulator
MVDRAELFPFLTGLSPRSRAEFGAIVASKAAAGATLLTRGAPCGGAYLVLRGSLRVFYFTEEGREATLYNVDPGGTCVLALSATLRENPFPAWAQAGRAGASFLRVPDQLFHHFISTEPAFRGFVLEAMAGRIFELMTALEQLATRTVVQRVAAYLIQHASEGEVAVTQEGLAAELGTAREVVFRALAGLAKTGVVAKRRGRVQIRRAAELAAVARQALE